MFETSIRIEFLSDWQIGSGLGNGPVADSILARDHNGLPFISGRAVKGALREGAWRLGLCRTDLELMETYIWGADSREGSNNQPSRISAGSAHLPEDVRAWLLSLTPQDRALHVEDLTILRTQTALEADGRIKPGSLRTLECGVPGIYFQSNITINAPELDQQWLTVYFRAVCAAVKSMGADRSRGLGNCEIVPAGAWEAHIQLPPRIATPKQQGDDKP